GARPLSVGRFARADRRLNHIRLARPPETQRVRAGPRPWKFPHEKPCGWAAGRELAFVIINCLRGSKPHRDQDHEWVRIGILTYDDRNWVQKGFRSDSG